MSDAASLQAPLPSGFGARSTPADVLQGADLSGTTALVTGGYSGIGLETTRALAGAGAHVIVPVRSPEKARAALDGLPNTTTLALDLLDPASIAACAEAVLAMGRPLHMLIANAGMMATPLTRDARGFEAQFSANHYGHFSLIVRLWPALLRAGEETGRARVVCLSSLGHRLSPVVFDDIHFQARPYDKWKAYGQSKTANALCAVGLDARGKAHGVRAFAVHPGGIMTDLQRHMPQEEIRAFGWVDEQGRVNEAFKTPAQGAATSVWCAASRQLDGRGGVYCEDCDIAQLVPADDKGMTGVRPWAVDPEAADALWRHSEAVLGLQLTA